MYIRRSCGDSRSGFTLIEVLISITILAVGIVLILEGMHTVLNVWEGAHVRVREIEAWQEAHSQAILDGLAGRVPSGVSGMFTVESSGAGYPGLYRLVPETDVNLPELLVYVSDQADQPGVP